VARLKAKGDGAKYKKFLTAKKFKEDFDGKKKDINEADKEAFTTKFQNLYQEQLKKKTGDEEESKESSQAAVAEKKMADVIQELDNEYFSDLRPEDIPDDCVSDVDNSAGGQTLESLEETAAKAQKDSITNAAADMVKEAEEANEKFMSDFVKLYAQDAKAAKATYYLTKVDIDITNDDGVSQQR
jgi:hypothetical protein